MPLRAAANAHGTLVRKYSSMRSEAVNTAWAVEAASPMEMPVPVMATSATTRSLSPAAASTAAATAVIASAATPFAVAMGTTSRSIAAGSRAMSRIPIRSSPKPANDQIRLDTASAKTQSPSVSSPRRRATSAKNTSEKTFASTSAVAVMPRCA